jgi:hypothetical protein
VSQYAGCDLQPDVKLSVLSVIDYVLVSYHTIIYAYVSADLLDQIPRRFEAVSCERKSKRNAVLCRHVTNS